MISHLFLELQINQQKINSNWKLKPFKSPKLPDVSQIISYLMIFFNKLKIKISKKPLNKQIIKKKTNK